MKSPRLAVAFLATGAFLLAASPGSAVRKVTADRRFEISGADGIPFNQPVDVTLSGGKLYVLDSLNNRLCCFDSRGRHLESFAGPADAPMTGALGLASDNRGRLFIADGARSRVLVQTGNSRPTVFAVVEAGKDQAKKPDPAGLLYYGDRLFVADNDGHRVVWYDESGKPGGTWGSPGDGGGRFKYPFRLAVDPRGRLAVTDVLNSRVQFFTPRGEYLSAFGRPGAVSGTLFRPGGLDIDQSGRVFVADTYFGAIQVFDVSGALLGVIHDATGYPLLLRGPVALRVSGGLLYVVETGAGKVSVFGLSGW